MARKMPTLTDEVLQAHAKDLEDPNREYWFGIYAVSARLKYVLDPSQT